MALNFSSVQPLQPKHLCFLIPTHKNDPLKLYQSQTLLSSSLRRAALSEERDGNVTEEELPTYSGSLSSARTQLDLLDQLTSSSSAVNGYESDSSSSKPTIRAQLAKLVGDRDDDFSIPLGKNLKKVSAKFLTVSQKRNIKRQAYLNEVSQRNDSVFFATIGAFVILPPLVILGIAIATGYVQLFP
ncbi:uncharacterized protein LOC107810436 [Nicotiana tabacum]|uniref:Uncharacterized protein LOC107810436 n=2 Tax=Nicotiana TaxID=4085 RepID=A0A1S4BPA5_TOBAC|nr:PREDICTED: uncharacterized protein LOC104237674 [Nicotiana sylvestris]XP_016490705.1 PREDICTED: uncharacterized protein LOC107810436 [Nicotiana tabacum]